jgi:prolyl-tRNA editing enzyme YbaK/EbsC (Cys-tRNA(Pro) deacylase)
MPKIEQVQDWLGAQGIEVWHYAQPTPTADLAARAVGCLTAQIAKTLLLMVGGSPLVVVTSGDMKVNSSLLKQATSLRGKVRLPEAEQVRSLTGYAPGGVCPFLLPAGLPVLLDSSLKRFERVFAAAGNAASAVPIAAGQLEKLTGGVWVEVCEAG